MRLRSLKFITFFLLVLGQFLSISHAVECDGHHQHDENNSQDTYICTTLLPEEESDALLRNSGKTESVTPLIESYFRRSISAPFISQKGDRPPQTGPPQYT